jgi:hypothetical protein
MSEQPSENFIILLGQHSNRRTAALSLEKESPELLGRCGLAVGAWITGLAIVAIRITYRVWCLILAVLWLRRLARLRDACL